MSRVCHRRWTCKPSPPPLTPLWLREDAGERGKDSLGLRSFQSDRQNTTPTGRGRVPVGLKLSQMTPHALGATGGHQVTGASTEASREPVCPLFPSALAPSCHPKLALAPQQPGVRESD